MAEPDNNKHGVLIVDDEEIIHVLGRRILENEKYTVFCSRDSNEALEILRSKSGDINLVFLDVVMPDVDGTDLARLLLGIKPDLRILFSSGYGATQEIQSYIEQGNADFIPKPFTREQVLEKVQKILA